MIIGIDTSCYTTSIAVVDAKGQLMLENRRILEVAMGSRGLSQSAALFQHIREGREVFSAALAELQSRGDKVEAVCVSVRPRPQEDSYMPVFLAGLSTAETLAATLGVPLYQTSHQEGHIMAGLGAAKCAVDGKFLAVQLSGGTSELLLVEPNDVGFGIDIIGATEDLHAGQLLDRTGVLLGLKFPCGPEMDALALKFAAEGGEVPKLKSSVHGYDFSFSGAEAELKRRITAGDFTKEAAAAAVFDLLARTLAKVGEKAAAEHGCKQLLLVGGVGGSQYLKAALSKRLRNVQVHFVPPMYAKDNAYGVALLGLKQAKNAGII